MRPAHLLRIGAVEFDDGQSQVGISIGGVQHEGALKGRLRRYNVSELELTGGYAHPDLGRTSRMITKGPTVHLECIFVLLLIVHESC